MPIKIIKQAKPSGSLIPVNSVSHDVVEVITSHKSIIIEIRLNKHFFYLLICQVLAQILSHFLQLQHCYSTLILNKYLLLCSDRRKRKLCQFMPDCPCQIFLLLLISRILQSQYRLTDPHRALPKFDTRTCSALRNLNL